MATPNLDLPTTPAGATNISIAYNEAMQILDVIVQMGIEGTLDNPPTTTESDIGKSWRVGTGTGDWAGHDDEIAVVVGENLWQFLVGGTQVKYFLDKSDGGFYKYDSGWVLAAGLGDAPSDGTGYVRKDGAWAAESGGGGSGDVVGPASSVDNTLPRFNTTTGKLLQGSGVVVTDNNEISGYGGNINLQTGTTYALVADDSGKIVELTNAAAITLTLPNNLPRGFCCTVVQGGAGVVTFDPDSGATLQNRSGHDATAGEGAFTSIYVSANTGTDAAWRLGGDTA